MSSARHDDDLVRLYHEASAGDPRRPSDAVRDAASAHARMLTQAVEDQAPELPLQSAEPRPAANAGRWRISMLGSLAVLGMAGLLVLQFDRGTPEERDLVRGAARPSSAPPAVPERGVTEQSAHSAQEPLKPVQPGTTTREAMALPRSGASKQEAKVLPRPGDLAPAPASRAPSGVVANASAGPSAQHNATVADGGAPDGLRSPPDPKPHGDRQIGAAPGASEAAVADTRSRPDSGQAESTARSGGDPVATRAVPTPRTLAREEPLTRSAQVADGRAPVPAPFPASAGTQPLPAPVPVAPPLVADKRARADDSQPVSSARAPAAQRSSHDVVNPERDAGGSLASVARPGAASGFAAPTAVSGLREQRADAARAGSSSVAPTRGDEIGDPRLLRIASLGRVAELRPLLAAGANLNGVDAQGRTPLMLAARAGHAPMVRALLDSGADARLTDASGKTARQHALDAGRDDIARLLDDASATDVRR